MDQAKKKKDQIKNKPMKHKSGHRKKKKAMDPAILNELNALANEVTEAFGNLSLGPDEENDSSKDRYSPITELERLNYLLSTSYNLLNVYEERSSDDPVRSPEEVMQENSHLKQVMKSNALLINHLQQVYEEKSKEQDAVLKEYETALLSSETT